MADTARRPRVTKLTCGLIVAALVIIIGGSLLFYYSVIYQGRAISRLTGVANQVALPKCITNPNQIISISFHARSNGETIKDITFTCPDGRVYSEEYNDLGIFQGSIEWTYQRPAAGQ